MRDASTPNKGKRFRERLKAGGQQQLLINVPVELVALMDSIVRQRGYRSRSAAVVELIEAGRTAIEQTNA